MKWLICCCLLFITSLSFTQNSKKSFSAIDWRAEDINANSPDTLSQLLTAPYTTQLDKVRSIFIWITEHIEYNTLRFQPYVKYHDDGVESEEDSLPGLRPLDERVARIVLKRRQTVCEGYARLFKTLCDFAGIKSEIICGYARSNSGSGKFQCNHNWNAVMIDSNWYLLDATWASGYLSFSGTEFIKDYNDNYFLTPPKYFIEDHYPEDVKWTLLDNPPTLNEFKNSPFKQSAFSRHHITSYAPSKGIINATVGDTINIELQTTDDNKQLCVTDESNTDSLTIANADSVSIVNKTTVTAGNKIKCSYVVESTNPQWLQVIYNGDIVLRYKLNIKEEPYPRIIIKDIAAKN